MRSSLILLLLLVAFFTPLALQAQAAMPRMTNVEPTTCKAGDELTVTGENLDKANVAEVFLTDGKSDTKVSITNQAATQIKFKVPAAAKGRLALMLLTKGKEPKLIEQPVKVSIEE
jgi:hypothetical protein